MKRALYAFKPPEFPVSVWSSFHELFKANADAAQQIEAQKLILPVIGSTTCDINDHGTSLLPLLVKMSNVDDTASSQSRPFKTDRERRVYNFKDSASNDPITIVHKMIIHHLIGGFIREIGVNECVPEDVMEICIEFLNDRLSGLGEAKHFLKFIHIAAQIVKSNTRHLI